MAAVAAKAPNAVEALIGRTASPFTQAVMDYPLPPKFKMPTIDTFDGSKDPVDHLETFRALMHLQAIPDEIMCRAFPVTLKGSARTWFNKLKPATVPTFIHLSKLFVSHYIRAQRQRRPAAYLPTIRQKKDETLREYVGRFNQETLAVDDVDDKVAVTAFMSGIRTGKLLFSLSKRPPHDMAELMLRA